MHRLVTRFSFSPYILPSVYVLLTLVAVSDALTRQGFAHGLLYIPLVLLAAFSNQLRHLAFVSSLAILLTWVGLWWAPSPSAGFSLTYVVANRLATTVCILVVAALSYLALRYQTRLSRLFAKLNKQQRQLRRTTQLAKVSQWNYNRTTDSVRMSGAIARLTGVADNQSIPRTQFAARFFGEGRLMLEAMKEAEALPNARSYENREIEAVFLDSNSRKRFVRLLAHQEKDGDVHGIMQDVTDLRLKEMQISQQMERYRTIAEEAPIILWQANAQGVIYEANDSLTSTVGGDRTAVVDKWIDYIHPQDQGRTVSQWNKCLRSGQPFRMEYRLRHEDGSYAWYLATAKPERNEQNQVTGWIGATIDIDYLKNNSALVSSEL
ncbi:hypothetical protein CWE12_12380 [Aliidiomarina sedimenti]|uniref:histidine kinase n=1 Tax=Aliidiomarina sedimenti TaxID=1933879 RepID=A0ABY0BUS9_9GAMM|nr:PAS domain-containing protein [Aliidiomarina sedimenti]RUO28019.1 hypothetical protein CWE12_12380 [Aliidiomarina sedimenti]